MGWDEGKWSKNGVKVSIFGENSLFESESASSRRWEPISAAEKRSRCCLSRPSRKSWWGADKNAKLERSLVLYQREVTTGLVEKPGIIKERPDTTCTKFKWSILMYFDPLNPILALVCRCRFILKSYGRKTTENQSKITHLANSAADFDLHSPPTTL